MIDPDLMGDVDLQVYLDDREVGDIRDQVRDVVDRMARQLKRQYEKANLEVEISDVVLERGTDAEGAKVKVTLKPLDPVGDAQQQYLTLELLFSC